VKKYTAARKSDKFESFFRVTSQH